VRHGPGRAVSRAAAGPHHHRLVVGMVAMAAWRGGSGGGRGNGGSTRRLVRPWVDAAGDELALDVRVPVVLDLVVRSTRQPGGDQRPPVHFISLI